MTSPRTARKAASGGFFGIVTAPKGGFSRAAEIRFSFPIHLTGAEHLSVWPEAHSNCHAGIQLTVFRKSGTANTYQLLLGLTDDNFDSYDAYYPECGTFEGTPLTLIGEAQLQTRSTPWYRLIVAVDRVDLGGGLFILEVSSKLVDSNGTPGDDDDTVLIESMTPKQYFIPSWYNTSQQGRRFGVGSIETGGDSSPMRFDDFKGSSC